MSQRLGNQPAHIQVRSQGLDHYKDAILDDLAESANVAQFISCAPDAAIGQRFSRVAGFKPNTLFGSVEEAVRVLLEASPDHSVNVRSFDPRQPKANEFIYGLRSVDAAVITIRRLATAGLHTIVNETIDVADGGVSGVAYGNVLEFAPGDTPRAVEKPGTVSFPRDLGQRVLEVIYGFRPELSYPPEIRVEFSLHPLRRGVRREHTIVWEIERLDVPDLSANLRWPNLFSRMLGDKAFGLVIADAQGLPVPATIAIPRRLPPFTFGRPTGTGETWIRTCPLEPVPGKYTTEHHWRDPFALLEKEDEGGSGIASVLAQEGVESAFSGGAAIDSNGQAVVEGVPGSGEDFMLGRQAPLPLPTRVVERVTEAIKYASQRVGPVDIEWVLDPKGTVWFVQLRQGVSSIHGDVVYPGSPKVVHRFNVEDGLEAFRALVVQCEGTADGIVLVGEVGVTSHFGDVVRKAKIPTRIERGGPMLNRVGPNQADQG